MTTAPALKYFIEPASGPPAFEDAQPGDNILIASGAATRIVFGAESADKSSLIIAPDGVYAQSISVGNLDVRGPLTIDDALTIQGDTGGNAWATSATTGALLLSTNATALDVHAPVTFNNDVEFLGNVNIDFLALANGTLYASNLTVLDDIVGNAIVANSSLLSGTGAIGTLHANTISVERILGSNATAYLTNLTVRGAASFGGPVHMYGNVASLGNLHISSGGVVSASNVFGAGNVTLVGDLELHGSLSFGAQSTSYFASLVSNDVTTNTLHVGGDAQLSQLLISSDLTATRCDVLGNCSVAGTLAVSNLTPLAGSLLLDVPTFIDADVQVGNAASFFVAPNAQLIIQGLISAPELSVIGNLRMQEGNAVFDRIYANDITLGVGNVQIQRLIANQANITRCTTDLLENRTLLLSNHATIDWLTASSLYTYTSCDVNTLTVHGTCQLLGEVSANVLTARRASVDTLDANVAQIGTLLAEGNLHVGQSAQVDGTVSVFGRLDVSGNTQVVGNVTTQGDFNCDRAFVSGNVVVSQNLYIPTGNLIVPTGVGTFDAIAVSSSANIAGNLRVSNTLNAGTVSTPNVDATFASIGDLEANNANIYGVLTVGSMDVGQTLRAPIASVSDTLSAANVVIANILTVTQEAVVTRANVGNLVVSGTATVNDLAASNTIVRDLQTSRLVCANIELLQGMDVRGGLSVTGGASVSLEGPLKVLQDVVIEGALTIDGASGNAGQVALSVAGDASFTSLTVSNTLTLKAVTVDAITVNQVANVATSLVAKGTVSIGGIVTCNGMTVAGAATFLSGAVVTGTVSCGPALVSGQFSCPSARITDTLAATKVNVQQDVTCNAITSGSLSMTGGSLVVTSATPALFNNISMTGGLRVTGVLSVDGTFNATALNVSQTVACDTLNVSTQINTPTIASPQSTLYINSQSKVIFNDSDLVVKSEGIYTNDVWITSPSTGQLYSLNTIFASIITRNYVEERISALIPMQKAGLTGSWQDLIGVPTLIDAADIDRNLDSLRKDLADCVQKAAAIGCATDRPLVNFVDGGITFYRGVQGISMVDDALPIDTSNPQKLTA